MYRCFKAPSFDCVSEMTALPREGMGVEDEYKRPRAGDRVTSVHPRNKLAQHPARCGVTSHALQRHLATAAAAGLASSRISCRSPTCVWLAGRQHLSQHVSLSWTSVRPDSLDVRHPKSLHSRRKRLSQHVCSTDTSNTVTTATEYCLLTAVRTSTVSWDKDVLGHDSRTLISHQNILQDSAPARDNRQVRHVIATLAYSQLVE
ncbi:hypothetical protein C0Q70_04065 [Pomacea canaliculata]|uniref:Uncharacterized protein n=1 Tax=Pomacea canaliculata TaxID=400727 RepID=A0A2T7PUH4_POMCA|nr:hypothetical protein C0Q70_04065 [Pomacea canaliculata]